MGLRCAPVPVSVFFHDTEWACAYRRVILKGLSDDAERLRAAYVDSAVHNLELQPQMRV